MRILFLSHYFPPEGNAPATRVHSMARRWVRDGHEVQVVTCVPNVPSGVPYPGYRNRLVQTERVDGIDVTRVWTYLAPNAGFARRIANYGSYLGAGTLAALAACRPDVVVATSPQPFCGLAGGLTATLRRRPFVLEVRDIWPESVSAVGAIRNPRVLRTLERLASWMHRSADQIVTVGEGYRDELERRGIDASRIDVLPNGVDRDFFAPAGDNEPERRKWGFEDEFVCSYVGTVGMAAGLDVVLRAARRLESAGRTDVRFLIVGDGAEREQLEAASRQEGLGCITFTGRLPKTEVRSALAASDACLVHLRKTPLFETVLPSKLFEAAAMEKPVVLGVRGDAQRLLERARGGIAIEPEDERGLVDALSQLRDDVELRKRLGRQGREFFSTRFDRDDLARRYADILDRVVREHTRARATWPAPSPKKEQEGVAG